MTDTMYDALAAEQELSIRGIAYDDWLAVMRRGLINGHRRTNALFRLDSVLPFGKYAGETVENVCRADPGWMRWFLAQPTSYWFTSEVLALSDGLQSDSQRFRSEPSEFSQEIGDGD